MRQIQVEYLSFIFIMLELDWVLDQSYKFVNVFIK